MKLNESFDSAPIIYENSRPSYPDEVIDWILNRTNIAKNERLLEIGSGTGQATIKFSQRGYGIHCVEMGKNLAELLMKKCENQDVTVDISSFESWKPPFLFKTSLIFSATAFHWINHDIRYKKCYDLLKNNGHLALLWNIVLNSEDDVVKKAYELLWEYYLERKEVPRSIDDIKNDRKSEIINSGFFSLEDYLDYKWSFSQTRENFTKGFFSQSSYLSLDEEKQKIISAKVEDLFKKLPDVIETELYTTAYIAKKCFR